MLCSCQHAVRCCTKSLSAAQMRWPHGLLVGRGWPRGQQFSRLPQVSSIGGLATGQQLHLVLKTVVASLLEMPSPSRAHAPAHARAHSDTDTHAPVHHAFSLWRRTGDSCDALDLVPSRRGLGYHAVDGANSTSTWGGSVVRGDDGSWHMCVHAHREPRARFPPHPRSSLPATHTHIHTPANHTL